MFPALVVTSALALRRLQQTTELSVAGDDEGTARPGSEVTVEVDESASAARTATIAVLFPSVIAAVLLMCCCCAACWYRRTHASSADAIRQLPAEGDASVVVIHVGAADSSPIAAAKESSSRTRLGVAPSG
ncbi:hypothetical protein KFE25_013550 [Diacronema lutheri]|uniref:Uncharacterized protein n=2 Tax=Diacronema lutheri TaxID=2081491 RepID=A0A8J5XU58_DIALT|nr:hypothetical protein KFE25_013550 [Diacronema lutheri]